MLFLFYYFSLIFSKLSALHCPACIQRGGGFTQAGGPQRFGRAINFQIRTKLSAGIHPRLRETARWAQAFLPFYSVYLFIKLLYFVYQFTKWNIFSVNHCLHLFYFVRIKQFIVIDKNKSTIPILYISNSFCKIICY